MGKHSLEPVTKASSTVQSTVLMYLQIVLCRAEENKQLMAGVSLCTSVGQLVLRSDSNFASNCHNYQVYLQQ